MNQALRSTPFGQTPQGEAVHLFTLRNDRQMEVSLTDWGAILTSIRVPDQKGEPGEVSLGFDRLSPYLERHPFFGAIVGRYANRIAGGRFSLLGKDYSLATNLPPNHLHGGNKGIDKAVWKAVTGEKAWGPCVSFSHTSPDGEEGYPGEVQVTVGYSLDQENTLRIEYEARCSAPTVLNLTNHAYFNLHDGGKTSITDHQIRLNASFFTPVNEVLIPTGEIKKVYGPLDLRTLTPISDGIDDPDIQIQRGSGYDHNFVIDKSYPGELAFAARVEAEASKRFMEVFTTCPGIQFYTGNHLDGTLTGHGQIAYRRRSGLCLETQFFPDSPNHAHFPSTVLLPGQVYEQATHYRFGVMT